MRWERSHTSGPTCGIAGANQERGVQPRSVRDYSRVLQPQRVAVPPNGPLPTFTVQEVQYSVSSTQHPLKEKSPEVQLHGEWPVSHLGASAPIAKGSTVAMVATRGTIIAARVILFIGHMCFGADIRLYKCERPQEALLKCRCILSTLK